MNLLLIEPDADQGRQWQGLLSRYAQQVDLAFDGRIGYSFALNRLYDGIILHLPDPVSWVQTLRTKGSLVPILILTPSDTPVDPGLLSGQPWVDHYQLPWQPEEIWTRLQFLADRRRVSMGAN